MEYKLVQDSELKRCYKVMDGRREVAWIRVSTDWNVSIHFYQTVLSPEEITEVLRLTKTVDGSL